MPVSPSVTLADEMEKVDESSLLIVRVPVRFAVRIEAFDGSLRVTDTDSAPSGVVSPITTTGTFFDVSPRRSACRR